MLCCYNMFNVYKTISYKILKREFEIIEICRINIHLNTQTYLLLTILYMQIIVHAFYTLLE